MSEVNSGRATEARERRRSRYDRPRTYVSWLGLLIGLALGIGGGLYYAWNISPMEEVNILPWQLSEPDKNAYLAAVMLQYGYDGALDRTIAQVQDLRLGGNDPIEAVVDQACDLARTSYVNDNTGQRNVRAMMFFYQLQGKDGCADGLIPLDPITAPTEGSEVLVLPTPTPPLEPSKTPTPRGTLIPTNTPRPFVPTQSPNRAFDLVSGIPTFCNADLSGVIEVFVQDFNGQGVPGLPVRVSWADGESTFFTGLKPERGPGYADFQMEPGVSYTIVMPGLSDLVPTPLVAGPCNLEGGGQSVTSYRLTFRGG